MRRCSALGPGMGSPGPACRDNRLAPALRRCDPVAGHCACCWFTAAGTHGGRPPLLPRIEGTTEGEGTGSANFVTHPTPHSRPRQKAARNGLLSITREGTGKRKRLAAECCQPFFYAFKTLPMSAVSAAMTAATVEAPATATVVSAAIAPSATPARVSEPRASVPSISPTPAPQPPRTMEPRASSDENATRKPVSAVVAVRRTGVRVVPVVSILTDRRRSNIYSYRTDSDSHAHLRLRISKRHYHHHRHHRQIFHVPHTHLLVFGSSELRLPGSEDPFQSL